MTDIEQILEELRTYVYCEDEGLREYLKKIIC